MNISKPTIPLSDCDICCEIGICSSCSAANPHVCLRRLGAGMHALLFIFVISLKADLHHETDGWDKYLCNTEYLEQYNVGLLLNIPWYALPSLSQPLYALWETQDDSEKTITNTCNMRGINGYSGIVLRHRASCWHAITRKTKLMHCIFI